jgi:hypothetical protein
MQGFTGPGGTKTQGGSVKIDGHGAHSLKCTETKR